MVWASPNPKMWRKKNAYLYPYQNEEKILLKRHIIGSKAIVMLSDVEWKGDSYFQAGWKESETYPPGSDLAKTIPKISKIVQMSNSWAWLHVKLNRK